MTKLDLRSLQQLDLCKFLFKKICCKYCLLINFAQFSDNNQIKSISGAAFNGLNKLLIVDLLGNECIDKSFTNKCEDTSALSAAKKEKCGGISTLSSDVDTNCKIS